MLDQVDPPFIEAMAEEWGDCPPLDLMVAAYLGFKPKEKSSNDYSALLAMFPGGVIR